MQTMVKTKKKGKKEKHTMSTKEIGVKGLQK